MNLVESTEDITNFDSPAARGGDESIKNRTVAALVTIPVATTSDRQNTFIPTDLIEA